MSGYLTRLCFGPLAALAAGIAIGLTWRLSAPMLEPARAPEVFRASPTDLSSPPSPAHIVLSLLRGHPDEAIVRAYFAANPNLPNLDELSPDDDLDRFFGPESELWNPDLPFGGQRWLRVFVGRFFLEIDRLGREEHPKPDLVVLIDTPETCGYDGCDAFVLSARDGSWRYEVGLYGVEWYRFATVMMARVPMEGRVPGSEPPWRYGPPIVVSPVNDGRPTFFWRTGGVYWDGKDWVRFCWDQCVDG